MSTTDQSAIVAEHPLLPDLIERIRERESPERAESLEAFARAYLRRMPDEQMAAIPVEELLAHVVGLYGFADARGIDPIAVRAFNPTPADHGYQTPGSVVEASCEDSPFLIDSVAEALQAMDVQILRMLHPVVGTERDEQGRIVRVRHARHSGVRESVMHFEVDRRLPQDQLHQVERTIRRVLHDVHLAVRDFDPMQTRVRDMIELARRGTSCYAQEEVTETVAFLEWLLDLNFVFLGYRGYELIEGPGGPALAVAPGSGLGILSDPERSQYAKPVPLSRLEPGLRERVEGGDLLLISKTNAISTVHRRAKMDYIGVKRVAPDGRILGEARLIGLFTSKAYMEPASKTPLLHRKLDQILRAEDLFEGSHDYKMAVSIFESFPKDELFQAPIEELRSSVMGLLALQERRGVRVFIRRDLVGRSVSILVAMPRDSFSADVRHRLQDLLMKRFHGSSVDYHLALGEADPAQVHFTVWITEGHVPDVSFKELEEEVVALTTTWEDRLEQALVERYGTERGHALVQKWIPRFPEYYRDSEPPIVLGDIGHLELLEAGEEAFVVGVQNEEGHHENLTRLALYRLEGKVQLSDVLPILETLGLRVVEEVPTRIAGGNHRTYIHDFGVLGADGRPLDVEAVGARVERAVAAMFRGEAQGDSLNRLIIAAGLDHRQAGILRAYRTYAQRLGSAFTEEFVNDTFAKYPSIGAGLVRLFEQRFEPGRVDDAAAEEETRSQVLEGLDEIRSLDEDRVLRGHLGLIDATVRTNAFRPERTCLSLKLRSADVPEMPKPAPLFEIFVSTVEVEGIHVRGGKVARGGIRWSDRSQDYRTEVLGLMKAQMTKNAVIVPTGSKGGFVLRRPPPDPDALRDEVRRQYVTFIRGLLDVTDNLAHGSVVHPQNVRVHDGDDPYLVVAADKGTATMSDTANAVAAEYGFWLGDAFASGGSNGYDHKALGITARGAWESVKRHFRELGHDVQTSPFTVVGIGDLSGDVFGNGMLLSPQIKLVAAFDHRHVFLDPNPDPERSFAERRRMFDLGPGTSWESYDTSVISEGGGVHARSAKRVPISPQVRERLGLGEDVQQLTPPELISSILRAPVDLLWNGGIGTYVKSSDEANDQVGDRANDAVRVNGSELRSTVVGEGGNLGFTQRGRSEYAALGGRINTDFIDNSAGVDLSDHEVNLKILLGLAIELGELDPGGRDALIHEVTDDVVGHVLYDNFLQAQILSQEREISATRMEAYEDLMSSLESEGMLDRRNESLPSGEEMAERIRSGRGMVRPELAVLLAYAKRSLSAALLSSDLPEGAYFEGDLRDYFPPRVVERFGHLLEQHPLRRELIATIVANDVVNSQGITFTSRLVAETGAQPADITRAYRIARDVTGAVERWETVEALVGTLDPEIQNELMSGVDWLVETTARWYLARSAGLRVTDAVGQAREGFERLSAAITSIGSGDWRVEREAQVRRLTEAGVPAGVASTHAFQAELVHGPDIIELAAATGRSVEDVARVFHLLGPGFHIDWLESRLDELPAVSRWQRWALQAMQEDLLLVRRQLAERVLAEAGGRDPEEAVRAFIESRGEQHARLERFMQVLAQDGVSDLAPLAVAVRQIRAVLGA